MKKSRFKDRGFKCLILLILSITLIIISLVTFKYIKNIFKHHHLQEEFCQLSISYRLDCHPEPGANQKTCLDRGCCWKFLNNSMEDKENIPYCFYPSKRNPFYHILNVSDGSNLLMFMKKNRNSAFPENINLLKLQTFFSEDIFRITIKDAESSRFEAPVPLNFLPHENSSIFGIRYNESDLKMIVYRKTNDSPLFTLDLSTLIFSKQLIQLSQTFNSTCLYGIGEHQESLCLDMNWNKIGLFASDQPPEEKKALYGVQPFYMSINNDGQSFGVLILNSNAMEFLLQPAPAITYRTTGGIIDMYVFWGPTPSEVVRQYIKLVGRPFMPPYWSLGFHLSRFGYNTLDVMNETLNRNLRAGIPVDVQWNDIDAMEENKDFTFDLTRFKDLPAYVGDLHNRGMRYITIIDSGIAYDNQTRLKGDIFVKNSAGEPLVGRVWPGPTVWPDFSNPRTQEYWNGLFKEYHKRVALDGAWIDMNEPANFVDGSLLGCSSNSTLDNPPYLTKVNGPTLNYHTICMSAQQNLSSQYNMHNLYGYQEAVATYKALTHTMPGKRPFIITRSNYVGIGAYSGHWTGDVYSTFHAMALTIPAILNYNIFGIPMIGADICGFNGNTTATLCNRWLQLGSFYPFSRTHNTDDASDQDPAYFQLTNPSIVDGARVALNTRYTLLPHLYTLFYLAHTLGDTVARPLFLQFPYDKNTFTIDKQFLWGASLLISPVLEDNVEEVRAYFPDGPQSWYDFYNGSRLESSSEINWLILDAPFTKINLHVKAGSIIPMQEPALSTTLSRYNAYWLLVALDVNRTSQGVLYIDDGETLDLQEGSLGKYDLVNFEAANDSLYSLVEVFNYLPSGQVSSLLISNVTIFGLFQIPSMLYINEYPQPAFRYSNLTGVLYVENLKIFLKYPFFMRWEF